MAQEIFGALEVNDDINRWHRDGILPMITEIASRHYAALAERAYAEGVEDAVVKVGQVRIRLWREYTDSQIVLLNMVCNEILPELEALKAAPPSPVESKEENQELG